MGWPYQFVDLSPEENSARRLILNKYGDIAQLSALSVIVAVAAWRWLVPKAGVKLGANGPPAAVADSVELRARSGGDEDETAADDAEVVGLMAEPAEREGEGEPDTPTRQPAASNKAENVQRPRDNQLSKWLDGHIVKGWKETRRQVLAMGLWGAWLLVLVFRQTGEDYLHLTKRFAQVAASLLPLHYLLGTSSRLSPLPKLLKVSVPAQYNAYHRLNGAIILILLACHASLYTNFYIQKGLLFKRAQDLDVQMGLSMAATLSVLAFFARDAVRKSWRPAFVLTHVVGAGLMLGLLFFHATVARWYAIEGGMVYAAVLYEKLMRSRRKSNG